MTEAMGSALPPNSDSVLLSEEKLRIGLPVRVSGGLRVRKVVVTETVTQTVQLRREELVVDELGIDDLTFGATMDGAVGVDLHDHEFEIVLHEERVVVSTRIVPVERVRVRTRIVTDLIEVSDHVRQEQVELTNASDAHGQQEKGLPR